ncbi:hypothetical protein CANARDRAFT_234686 [[Candida] arabinofermentans NRRL YB-2248]|uniref:Serine/threonine-protein kinase RIO1 n=1 Tax=[Candida] arabinofermentans NRRL YB-2248 TaxID=983967 RepID=A0A1E4SZK6_9ASCO|nr:hypothetical protein CANARDRAFT_234686 [[Candida] arabinofermentans NRRL YB-2248]
MSKIAIVDESSQLAEALEQSRLAEGDYSDYDSDSDYYSSSEDELNTKRPSHNATNRFSSINTAAQQEQQKRDNDASRVLQEKTDLLERYSQNMNFDQFLNNKHRITRDKSERATVEQVLDPRTLGFLSKLFKNGTITKINGCISTGKEANVYHAVNEENGREFAVKIYKTSILVFKDRERYVDGEFRFRNTRNQSNPRKMVKIWAEKEFRNLKRLHLSGIPSPEPIDLKSHVLVMEYLSKGDGWPSPKLKDYEFPGGVDEIVKFYHKMLVWMRLLFQKCRLVHADLSEYNSIVHNNELYIFDVSQSVEPDHGMSMDFLRMDIKNVNDFFSRLKKINVYPERLIFKYIIQPWTELIKEVELNEDEVIEEENISVLEKYLNELPLKTDGDDEQKQEDEVFRSLHLVSSLNHLEERDFEKFKDGHIDTLRDLVAESDEEDSDDEETDDDSSDESDEDENGERRKKDKGPLKGKKHEDKDLKKDRKKQAKDEAKEKRKSKLKKHLKKKALKKGGKKK